LFVFSLSNPILPSGISGATKKYALSVDIKGKKYWKDV
jgi:hypothetical protein